MYSQHQKMIVKIPNTKLSKSQNGLSAILTPNGGYSLKNNQSKTQKAKSKNGQNPFADIVCFAGCTFYPQWKGSITDLQKWLMETHGSSKFHTVNTNSIMSRVGHLSINFYLNSGSFQINKGRGPFEKVEAMTLSIKEWLAQNHDETRDMIQEAISFLNANIALPKPIPTQMSGDELPSPTKAITTPSKQGGENHAMTLALNTVLAKTFITPIEAAALKVKDKSLYEERYEHVTTIWNTIVEHMLLDGTFVNYQEWITQYSNDNLMKYSKTATTWFSNNIPKIYALATETFSAHDYSPPQINTELKRAKSLPNLTVQHTGTAPAGKSPADVFMQNTLQEAAFEQLFKKNMLQTLQRTE